MNKKAEQKDVQASKKQLEALKGRVRKLIREKTDKSQTIKYGNQFLDITENSNDMSIGLDTDALYYQRVLAEALLRNC